MRQPVSRFPLRCLLGAGAAIAIVFGTLPAMAESKMPQLDPEFFVPQLFWLAVTFLVLYVLMRRVAIPKVGAAIEARRSRLDDDLARAAQMTTEAEAVRAAYEKTLADARSQAQAIMRETSDRLSAEAAERQRQVGETLAQQTEAAERRIGEAKSRALTEVRGIAIDVARSLTEKLTGAAAEEARLAAAVDGALRGAGAETAVGAGRAV